MPETLNGSVESIVFRNEQTGYTVCSVRLGEGGRTATLVGNCAAVWVGEDITAEGEWTRHPQHGTQFKAASITCVAPASTRGIERFLAGGTIRGVGREYAKRLVERFAENTLYIIEKESKRLEEVEGIGPTRRRRIKESWDEQRGVRDIMIFLQSHGIGTAQATRIYKTFGQDAIGIVSQNPYCLCREVWGIGFKTADGIAQSVGIPPDSEARARAGLVYVLETMAEQGHCFALKPQLLLDAEELLGIPVEKLAEALKKEIEAGSIVVDGERAYPTPLYRDETSVAMHIRRLLHGRPAFRPIVVEKAIAWAEQRMHLTFAAGQHAALGMALSEKACVLTGGPGVGKTTIIRSVVDVYEARQLTVKLAAPTGRAAKRMTEATGREASTIHRLLKYNPRLNGFEHDSDTPLQGDIFIFDEMSMVDIRLMHSLLAAVPDHACLILVGDVDQLPSVGPGNVLHDLISSGRVPFSRLDTIFRQKHGSRIVENAHRVNRGDTMSCPGEGSKSDFYFVHTDDPEQVVSRTLALVTDRIPKRFGFDPMSDIQVLSPMRRGLLGTDNLNTVLQEALNPRGVQLQRFGRLYRQGDRVMQIRNNYEKEVFNGDIGRIASIDIEDQGMSVDLDGRRVEYDLAELDELVHAYACTIHKSQGSEYPVAVILLATQHFKLLQRNLLYTAITRGKKLVCIVGSRKAAFIATKNNDIRLRQTALAERVRTSIPAGTPPAPDAADPMTEAT